MSLEGQLRDQKSLRAITGKTADWKELAKDCVAFANAIGGKLLIGIEDGETAHPPRRLAVGNPNQPANPHQTGITRADCHPTRQTADF